MLEIQNTTYDGDIISGEIVIHFEKIRLDDFLKYRGRIRAITGFGEIGISHTKILERAYGVEREALITKCNLERRPDEHREAMPSPQAEVKKEPGLPKPVKVRSPYLTSQFRKFFEGLKGSAYAEVITKFRISFKNKHKSDGEIIEMFKRVQGIQ